MYLAAIEPRLLQATKILQDFKKRNAYTQGRKPIGENVPFNDNPVDYLEGVIGDIAKDGEAGEVSLVALRNAISEIKGERDLFITQSQKSNIADKIIKN